MKISMEQLGKLCAKRDVSLSRLLAESGVSRNAFYSLARKDSVLPNSIRAIAAQLGAKPSDFLDDEDVRVAKAAILLRKVDKIAGKYPDADRDNIRHTLLLLEKEPIERLRRALIRGQKSDIH